MDGKYNLVIFDIDGTLIDSADGIVRATIKAIDMLDLPKVPESEIRKCIGPPLAKTMVSKGLLDEKDFDLFNETFRDYYKNEFLLDASVYPGVVDVLKTLSGKIKMAVATNKRFDYTLTLLEKIGIMDYFDVVKGTDFENRLNKTDLIRDCLKDTGTSPDRSVMIGDTINDRKAAEGTYVDFIGVTYGYGFHDDNMPEKIIDDIRELPGLIL